MTAPSTHAFPSIEGPGMTLRQWYAGQALAGLTSMADNTGLWQWDSVGVAGKCVEIAEAMIAALKESGDG